MMMMMRTWLSVCLSLSLSLLLFLFSFSFRSLYLYVCDSVLSPLSRFISVTMIPSLFLSLSSSFSLSPSQRMLYIVHCLSLSISVADLFWQFHG